MTAGREDRAVAALKAAYERTSLPDAAKRRISRAVFAKRSSATRRPRAAFAIGLAAALVVAVVVCLRAGTTAPTSTTGARYAAVVRSATGDVRVTSTPGAAAVRAAADMRLDAFSVIETGAGAAASLDLGPHRISVREGSRLELRDLERGAVDLEIERGGARFAVAHLARDERFAVAAGGLTVEVVGTRFEVSFDRGCPAVSVEEGRVRAAFGDGISFVTAGESRRFCEADEIGAALRAPVLTEKVPRSTAPKMSTGSTASTVSTTSTDPAAAQPPVPLPISEEERLYRDALDSRARGDLTLASTQMAGYVARYPDGTFAEEALFSLVRLGYRRHAVDEVLARGADYLGRYPSRSAKTDEVRILLADGLQRRGAACDALEALSPVDGDIDSVARPYREQALALCVAAASGCGRTSEARRCAAEYVARYPDGDHVGEAKAITEEKGRGEK